MKLAFFFVIKIKKCFFIFILKTIETLIANWLNEKRIPLEDVQLMAGHKTTGTT